MARSLYPEVDEAMQYLDQFGTAKLTGTGACVFTEVTENMNIDDILKNAPCKAYLVQQFDKNHHYVILKFDIGASPSGKAPGFDLGIRWFESSCPCHHFSPVDVFCKVRGIAKW